MLLYLRTLHGAEKRTLDKFYVEVQHSSETNNMSKIPTNIKSKKLVEKRREQITNAAIKLFSLKGFHRTTLRDLAEEAGISHGNIYDYVGSKEDILLLIHGNIEEKAYSIMEAADEFRNPLEKLRRMVMGEIDASYTCREATLLFYQELKSLERDRLKELSNTERQRLERYEKVIEDCIREGKCKNVNPRLISNLIKVMVDIWPLKGWDLKGHTTKHQIEKTVLNGVFKGFLEVETTDGDFPPEQSLEGMQILTVNIGRNIGEMLYPFLLTLGAKIIAYHGSCEKQVDDIMCKIPAKSRKQFHLLYQTDHGPINEALFQNIVCDVGQVDAIIYNWDFSAGDNQYTGLPAIELDSEFRLACELIPAFKREISQRTSGQIIHLAPTYWSREENSILYETTTSRLIAFTKSLAADFAKSKSRINCIVPGYIDGMQSFKRRQELDYQIQENRQPGDLGKVDDVLECIQFLLSKKSNYINGQILNINGGIK